MNERFLYIHIHGDFTGMFAPGVPTHLNTCEAVYKGMDDSYTELTYAMLEVLKQQADQLGKVENLERVIFYSNTSTVQVLPANMLMWLLGRAPHPNNKDPDWIR